ncbi:hypothetical protein NHX12_031390 [Muraenolepis orangiensis]|uniref:Uncharacterized protein n=1 Tax=Muraenolepis orangiensis TaxID=630683 RepID=A0A9Q0E6Y4_9TELE|nr:hypothetical protein NHX12_031390 [Muraenolepis orangiensis]
MCRCSSSVGLSHPFKAIRRGPQLAAVRGQATAQAGDNDCTAENQRATLFPNENRPSERVSGPCCTPPAARVQLRGGQPAVGPVCRLAP